MAADLDELDFALIALLQENGRRSTSEIARLVETPESTVRRRIDRLLRDELVRVVAVVEDPSRLGLEVHASFAMRIAPHDEKEVIQQLVACDEIRWVAATTGSMNLLAEGFFHSIEHLRSFQASQMVISDTIVEFHVNIILGLYKNRFDWAAMARAQHNGT